MPFGPYQDGRNDLATRGGAGHRNSLVEPDLQSECRAEPGTFAPTIDRSKCEGKSDCVRVCPYDVFEVRRMGDDDFAKLGILGKLKSMAHGRKTAYTPRAADCRSCGKCVTACPEKAITLARLR
jgi:NAD-dependent dihydropyrimidine dehydrogenase PreA subunit